MKGMQTFLEATINALEKRSEGCRHKTRRLLDAGNNRWGLSLFCASTAFWYLVVAVQTLLAFTQLCIWPIVSGNIVRQHKMPHADAASIAMW